MRDRFNYAIVVSVMCQASPSRPISDFGLRRYWSNLNKYACVDPTYKRSQIELCPLWPILSPHLSNFVASTLHITSMLTKRK